jgi:hypothetical protein
VIVPLSIAWNTPMLMTAAQQACQGLMLGSPVCVLRAQLMLRITM